MARLLVKSGYHNDMCYDKIGLCTQNIDMILGLIVNTTGRANVVVQRERVSSFDLLAFVSQLQF